MKITALSQQNAELISHWHYPDEYSFYNTDADQEDLDELMSPQKRGDRFHQVLSSDNTLIGYFCIEYTKQDEIEIGLGMTPDLTGHGTGKYFINLIVEFIVKKYHPQTLLLDVAKFNIRAQKVYHTAGFKDKCEHNQIDDNGKIYPFIWMAKNV